ncbi:MAG: hypothetical protein WCS88_00565 [Patescibacteria group bacterium]
MNQKHLPNISENTTIDQLIDMAANIGDLGKRQWPKKNITAHHKVVGKTKSQKIKGLAVMVSHLKVQIRLLDKQIDALPIDMPSIEREPFEQRLMILDHQYSKLKTHLSLEIFKEFEDELQNQDFVGVGDRGQVYYLDIPGISDAYASIQETADDIDEGDLIF